MMRPFSHIWTYCVLTDVRYKVVQSNWFPYKPLVVTRQTGENAMKTPEDLSGRLLSHLHIAVLMRLCIFSVNFDTTQVIGIPPGCRVFGALGFFFSTLAVEPWCRGVRLADIDIKLNRWFICVFILISNYLTLEIFHWIFFISRWLNAAETRGRLATISWRLWLHSRSSSVCL